MGLQLMSEEADDLMEYLGHENRMGKVVINYMEFTDFVNDFRSDRRDSSDARGVDRIILRLGKEVAKRTRNGRSFDMHKPFNRADRRNKGVVDERTFKRCMEDLDADGGLELSSSEYKSIFKEFADDGMINYEWFLDEIIKSGKSHGSSGRSGAKAKAKGHVEELSKRSKGSRKAWKEGVDYHEAFVRLIVR